MMGSFPGGGKLKALIKKAEGLRVPLVAAETGAGNKTAPLFTYDFEFDKRFYG